MFNNRSIVKPGCPLCGSPDILINSCNCIHSDKTMECKACNMRWKNKNAILHHKENQNIKSLDELDIKGQELEELKRKRTQYCNDNIISGYRSTRQYGVNDSCYGSHMGGNYFLYKCDQEINYKGINQKVWLCDFCRQKYVPDRKLDKYFICQNDIASSSILENGTYNGCYPLPSYPAIYCGKGI